MRVAESYTRGAFDSPKSHHGRSVPMADRLARELEHHFQRSYWRADDDLVFAHPLTGHVIDASKLRKRFYVALETAGLHRITFHELRHTFGTQMAAAGAPLRAIQEWMGHADASTTEIYAHYAPDPSGGREVRAARVRRRRGGHELAASAHRLGALRAGSRAVPLAARSKCATRAAGQQSPSGGSTNGAPCSVPDASDRCCRTRPCGSRSVPSVPRRRVDAACTASLPSATRNRPASLQAICTGRVGLGSSAPGAPRRSPGRSPCVGIAAHRRRSQCRATGRPAWRGAGCCSAETRPSRRHGVPVSDHRVAAVVVEVRRLGGRRAPSPRASAALRYRRCCRRRIRTPGQLAGDPDSLTDLLDRRALSAQRSPIRPRVTRHPGGARPTTPRLRMSRRAVRHTDGTAFKATIGCRRPPAGLGAIARVKRSRAAPDRPARPRRAPTARDRGMRWARRRQHHRDHAHATRPDPTRRSIVRIQRALTAGWRSSDERRSER